MQDAYAINIASVQKKTDVVATADICNSQGQVIVKKGSVLTDSMTEKIVRFKLLIPLDQTVAIENEVNKESLLQCFHDHIALDPLYSEIHDAGNIDEMLTACCDSIAEFPMLRQKLTVLQLELPKFFNQAVFTAWLSVLICVKLKRNNEYTKAAFMVAMLHDIGLLHISPSIFSKTSSLDVDETKQLHAHPIIGQRILSGVNGISLALGEAVLEHHETVDGRGYPAGKIKDRWNAFGRIVFLVDNIYGIYNNQVKRSGYSLHAVIPVVLLSQYSRKNAEFGAFVQIIKQASPPEEKTVRLEEVPGLAAKIKSGCAYVSRFVAACSEISAAIGSNHEDARLTALQSSFDHVSTMMVESGLLDYSFEVWLTEVEVKQSESEYTEVEKSFFLIKEVVYQVRGIKNQAQVFFANPKNKAILEKISDALKSMDMTDTPGF